MDYLHALIGDSTETINTVQMSLRAVTIFVAGLIAVRIAATRAFGKWGALDIIFAVIVGSNLSRALTGSAPFLPTLAATGVLIVLHAAVARLAAHWSWIGRLTKGVDVQLICEGEIDHGALRRNGLGEGDIQSALRVAGYTKASQISEAYLERNGDISIIPRRDEAGDKAGTASG